MATKDPFHLIIVVAFYVVFHFVKFLLKRKKKASREKQKPTLPPKPMEESFQDFHNVNVEEEIRRRITERQKTKNGSNLLHVQNNHRTSEFGIDSRRTSDEGEARILIRNEPKARYPTTQQPELRSPVKAMLCDKSSLQSAFLLSEILGKPVALKDIQ